MFVAIHPPTFRSKDGGILDKQIKTRQGAILLPCAKRERAHGLCFGSVVTYHLAAGHAASILGNIRRHAVRDEHGFAAREAVPLRFAEAVLAKKPKRRTASPMHMLPIPPVHRSRVLRGEPFGQGLPFSRNISSFGGLVPPRYFPFPRVRIAVVRSPAIPAPRTFPTARFRKFAS